MDGVWRCKEGTEEVGHSTWLFLFSGVGANEG